MSNMSYCRFHNTNADLLDCVFALEEREELSDSEMLKAKSLKENCERYLQAYEEYFEELENEE